MADDMGEPKCTHAAFMSRALSSFYLSVHNCDVHKLFLSWLHMCTLKLFCVADTGLLSSTATVHGWKYTVFQCVNGCWCLVLLCAVVFLALGAFRARSEKAQRTVCLCRFGDACTRGKFKPWLCIPPCLFAIGI